VLSDVGSTVILEQWVSLTENGLFCLRELAHVHYGRWHACDDCQEV